MSENCSKLRENIAREKADINRRNLEKYKASKQHADGEQEPKRKLILGDKLSHLGKSQNKQLHLGDLSHIQEELVEGGNLLENQMGIRIFPQIKLNMKKKKKRRIQIVQ